MKRMIVRAVAVAGMLAVGGAGVVLAGSPEEPPAKGNKGGWKRGQNWTAFATKFDADKDGKVSKAEFLAQRPGFDKVDANKDGAVTAEEVKAMPAAKKRGASGAGFVDRFDTDKDGKVSAAEYDEKRGKAFEAMDKNKDSFVDEGELKGHPKEAEATD